MRRLLAPLTALALCALGTPSDAAEEKGVLVVVSDGPGEGTITLPRATRWTGESPALTGSTPHLLLAVSTGVERSLAVGGYRGASSWRWQLRQYREVPAGRHTVRMLTTGPTTVRIPVTGFRGTRTVRLDRRLRGGFGEVRTVPVRDVHHVEDVIPFRVPKHSVLMHGVVRSSGGAVYADYHCTTNRGDRCNWPERPRNRVFEVDEDWVSLIVDFFDGDGDAVMKFTQVAEAPEPVTHFLLVLPTA